MDTKQYHLDCQVRLQPVGRPNLTVTFDSDIVYDGQLSEPVILSIDKKLQAGTYQLAVELHHKKDIDPTTAIIVEHISFNNINSPKFVWAGEYRPDYPEPWASQQQNLEPLLKSHNYLGWNGKWTLTFSVPIFTWVHQTENLGWIYN